MTKMLCKPCMISLQEKGKTVKLVGGRCEKITCAECGRRRFGRAYDVIGRRKKEVKEGGAE